MPDVTVKLTNRVIDQAVFSGARYDLHDTVCPGFSVRVGQRGKVFRVRYQTAAGVKRSLKLGTRGELSLDQARRMAREVRVAALRGEDPCGTRDTRRSAPTIADLAERYMNDWAKRRKQASSIRTDARNLRVHVLPAWGSRLVGEISRQDVIALHNQITKGRKGTRTPGIANRVLALLSKMFNLAELWDMRPQNSNPCRHVEKNAPAKDVGRALTGEEYARLGLALRSFADRPAATHADKVAVAVIHAQALLGCRIGELLDRSSADVDLERRVLTLVRSKTGPRSLPLPDQVVDVLRPYVEGVQPLFRNRSGDPFTYGAVYRRWRTVVQNAGLDGLRLHDLRHSAATLAGRVGLSQPRVQALLGHSNPQTTARYLHLVSSPDREPSEKLAAEVAAQMIG